MSQRDVFHEGEIAVQVRAGERATAVRNGVLIADRVMERARPFLAEQRLLVVAGLDAGGHPAVTPWCGPPGLVRSDDDGALVRVSTSPGGASPDDPLVGQLAAGQSVGLLAIELSTRRRLRLNGAVVAREPGAMTVRVSEAFPNCPKYIQRRLPRPARAGRDGASAERGTEIDERRRALIARVDTAFVASVHATRGLDASHRGGEPGFIHVEGPRALRFPDYPGNSMFQTLGNLALDPRAGLALVDFERGRVLWLAGTAAASFGGEDPSHPTGGTGRYWTFTVGRWVESAMPAALDWELRERSPFNPPPE